MHDDNHSTVSNALYTSGHMGYDRKISRRCPGLILFLLDESGSMCDLLQGTSDPCFAWVERYIGILFKLLLDYSTDMKGDLQVIKPRYFVYVIEYGSTPQVWNGGLLDIETAVEKYTQANNSLGLQGRLGGTDARSAMQHAYDFLKVAIQEERFRDSYPPMVFHLTDGMSHTDAEPIVKQIQQLSTSNGAPLVVNAFIGTQTSLVYQGPDDFPGYVEESEAGPSGDNKRLFNMSSVVPELMRQTLVEQGTFPQIRAGSHLFFDVRTREMLKHVIQVVGSMESRADR